MSIQKKMTAWFLVLVMVCSLFVSVPVSATEGGEENSQMAGFLLKDWVDEGPCVNAGAEFSKEMWLIPKEERLVYFAYVDNNTETPVTVSDISVTCNGETVEGVISDYPENSGYITVKFTSCGEYTFTYEAEGATDNTITVHVEMPEVGFFSSNERGEGTILDNNQFRFSSFEGEANTFYMILKAGENAIALDEEMPFKVTVYEDGDLVITDAETLAKYFQYEEVEDTDGTYKITVVSEKNFGLDVNAVVTEEGSNRRTGGYVNVGYQQTIDGLVAKDWIDWNDDGPYVNSKAEFSKEAGASPKEEKLFYLAYLENEGEETWTNITGDLISNLTVEIIGEEGTDTTEIEVSSCSKNEELVMIQFPECGDYIITYNGEGTKDKSVTVHVDYPEIGFYTTTTQSLGSFLADNRFIYSDLENEESKKFYLIMKSDNEIALDTETPLTVDVYDESLDKNVQITDVDVIKEQYVGFKELEDAPDIYEFTVLTDKNFGLSTNVQITDGEGNSWTESRYIDVQYVETGLLFGDVEANWNDELQCDELTGVIWEGSYSKEKAAEINSIIWLWLGTTENGEDYKLLSSTLFKNKQIELNSGTSYEVVEGVQEAYSTSVPTVILTEYDGIYGFYVQDDIELSYGEEIIKITKELPGLAFYKANEASFDNLIMGTYEMSESEMSGGKELYVLPRPGIESYTYNIRSYDRTIMINDGTFNAIHEEGPGMGTYVSENTFTEPIKIEVSQCATSFIEVFGKITIGTDTYDAGNGIDFSYQSNGENKSIIEDGKSHEGFAGCFISENDYKVNTWGVSNRNYYWVHADTIQGVIDELCRVAKEGPVTIGSDEYDIEATNYIWLNVSYFEYSKAFAEDTQHVVTPSNIKGIIMQSGDERYYAKYGESDYFAISCFVSEDDANDMKELCYVPDKDRYYPVRRIEGAEAKAAQADYIVVEDGETYSIDQLAGYEEKFDEHGNPTFVYPVFYPNLYVDATVEVKIMGNFGNGEADKQVQLGFYEGSTNKSIINGVEFSEKYIGDDPVIVGEGTSNEVTVTVTEFKASAECSKAPINGEDCEVTLGNENANLRDKIDIYQKGDDDYGDAKELAEGKPLKVKLDVQEAKADDAEVKKVAEQVEKDCSKDKTKPSKVQYLDIDMKYQVGQRDPKVVTETREEVDITMDIPDSFQKADKHAKKRRYKVYRYHDGKIDVLDAKFDNDKKKLHFKTDKFSTYALVAEDVVPTAIEVSANPTKLSYVEGEMFDTTGMTISLVYSDGTKEEITGYTVSVTSALALTDTVVTVSYEGFTAQVPITVIAKPEKLPKVGETVKTTNGTCKVTAIGLEGAVEVTFTPNKTNKKAKKARIDKKVTIDGKEYVVTAIAANAFSGNTKMTGISIPNTITKIGKNAFKGCTKLKKITIPKSVTVIGENAFYNCKKLSKVTIKGTKIKKIGKNAFKNVAKKSTIKVPKSKKKDYKKLLKKAGYKKTVK